MRASFFFFDLFSLPVGHGTRFERASVLNSGNKLTSIISRDEFGILVPASLRLTGIVPETEMIRFASMSAEQRATTETLYDGNLSAGLSGKIAHTTTSLLGDF